MTDRFKSLTVVLEQDTRDDDAAGLIAAIEHLRGVAAVKGDVRTGDDFANRARIKREIHQRLWTAFEEDEP